ncbi:MAG: right-handed parallel beta-helix repeat-containing protein [Georgenia sp.]
MTLAVLGIAVALGAAWLLGRQVGVPDPPVHPAYAGTAAWAGSVPAVGVPAGTTLTPVDGPVRLDAAGAVLEAASVSGTVIVAAPGVVIRNSEIRAQGAEDYGVVVESGDVEILDTEIIGFGAAVAGDDWAAQRLNIHGATSDGVKVGSNVVLTDSWIHDLAPSADSHADGVQIQSGVEDVLIRGNIIDVSTGGTSTSGNAAIFIAPDLGPDSPGPVVVAENLLDGGNYIVYCLDGSNGRFRIDDIRFIDNRFGRNYRYGPAAINVEITDSGNVWHDTGAALDL